MTANVECNHANGGLFIKITRRGIVVLLALLAGAIAPAQTPMPIPARNRSAASPDARTAGPRIPQRPAHVRSATFGNGAYAKLAGKTITVTLKDGSHMLINHPNPGPVRPRPSFWCEGEKAWLDSHRPNSAKWKRICLYYFEHCLGDD